MDTLTRLRQGKLAGAKRLDLSCGLTEFPREVFDLADTLEILNLSGNRLSMLPDDFTRLHRLRILFCSDNEFQHLPAVLGACEKLEMVGFKSNRIEALDEAVFQSKLRWLILTDNRIDNLPDHIGKCVRLQKLMLAGNRLENLPEGMSTCVELELIRLSANRFRAFPPWLFALPKLSWLGLAGNPWSEKSHSATLTWVQWTDLEILGKLGEGASGVIYQANWQEPGTSSLRPVAVKVFKGAMTSDGLPDDEMAVCLAAGNHPNLIEILGEISNHPDHRRGLVMSLVDTNFSSLADPPDFESCTRDVYPADRRFALSEVLRLTSGLASVARHLHSRGIMHGDFYAHNVLWNPEAIGLLGDFGAASHYPHVCSLERIETRAFGCLLGELLDRCDPATVPAGLLKLQTRCVAEVVAERPDFSEIVSILAGYIAD